MGNLEMVTEIYFAHLYCFRTVSATMRRPASAASSSSMDSTSQSPWSSIHAVFSPGSDLDLQSPQSPASPAGNVTHTLQGKNRREIFKHFLLQIMSKGLLTEVFQLIN